jgi:hypothetical protein
MTEKKKDEDGEDLRRPVTTPPPFEKLSGAITTDSPAAKKLAENMDANIAKNLREELAEQAAELRKIGVIVHEK